MNNQDLPLKKSLENLLELNKAIEKHLEKAPLNEEQGKEEN